MLLDYAFDLINLLYPTPCAICENIAPQIKSALCPACFFQITQISPLLPLVCASCGTSLDDSEKTHCTRCRSESTALDSLRSLAAYQGAMQEAILAFKFHGRRELAGPLGLALLSAPRPAWNWQEISALIPVPMHQSRFVERKFDHTLLLARSLRKHLRALYGIRIPVVSNVLRVNHPVAHQTRASREVRLKNLQNAFSVRTHCERKIHLQNILLIDDVITTGATLSGCAQRLRQHFPNTSIHGLTLARTSNL